MVLALNLVDVSIYFFSVHSKVLMNSARPEVEMCLMDFPFAAHFSCAAFMVRSNPSGPCK